MVEQRVQQIVVGETGEARIIELSPLGSGAGVAIEGDAVPL
jgi:hypothetical protein